MKVDSDSDLVMYDDLAIHAALDPFRCFEVVHGIPCINVSFSGIEDLSMFKETITPIA